MRIAIVEDDTLLLENLRVLLQGEEGCVVAGAWPSAELALAANRWDNVDILLSDIDLPGLSGVELIAQVKALHPGLNCMAYTISEDRVTTFAAIKAGASGYILQGCSPRELVEALRQLHAGGAPMSPRVARRVITEFQQTGGGGHVPEEDLPPRELEIVQLLQQARSYKEIAIALNISPHPVHANIKQIYARVHAQNRSEMLRQARERGWV